MSHEGVARLVLLATPTEK